MTDIATGPIAAEIARRLTAALDPVSLEVINDSARHAGHSGDNGTGESHFTVVVSSHAFEGASRVARQRMVNKALGDLLEEKVHALAIKARAPTEG